MLLSLATVRIASDSIFGWQERTPSSKPEVCVLALLGWCHWLLLSVAGAVIVARALKPLQQVAFAPDCVWGADDLSFRLVLIRRSVILYDLQVRIQAFAGGRIFDLPLTNGSTGYARWTGVFPLTFKHALDEDERPPQSRHGGGAQGHGRVRVDPVPVRGGHRGGRVSRRRDSRVLRQSETAKATRRKRRGRRNASPDSRANERVY
jgi:hypothetical protein